MLEYSTAGVPELKDGYALIKIKRFGICGTDLHAFEGTQPFFTYPRVLGHELAGELVNTGGAEGYTIGAAVTFIPYFNCGHCIACRSDKPNCCVDIKVCGVHIDGGMVEYLQVPANLLVHGDGLNYDELALIEPLAIGAHGVRRANIVKDEWVLVVGAGPIGLGIMEFARIAGAKVIAADTNEQRLTFCAEKLKVDFTINVQHEDMISRLREITGNDMPTVVIDATGNQAAINNGFNYLAHGGRYVLVGLQKGELVVSHPEFHKREAILMSSRNATREDFEKVVHCMKQGWINPQTYITHRVKFDEVSTQFKHWLNPANGVIKAMVEV